MLDPGRMNSALLLWESPACLTWSVMEALNAGLVAATVQEEIGQGRGEQGLEMDCGAARTGLHLG